MYSKNDYRYYLENQLIHSDDFLAHYGVKGMKWKHRKHDVTFERNIDPTTGGKEYRIDFNKHDGGHRKGGWSDGVGVRYTPKNKYTNRSISIYDTTRTKWDKKADDYVYENKKRGRLTKTRAEDGLEYRLDLSKKKKNKANKKKFKIKNPLAPKNQKVEIVSFKDQRTGVDYKKR